MKKNSIATRRNFLKTAAAGTAAGLLTRCLGTDSGGETVEPAEPGWKNGMQINPNIDNLRVVFVHDANMVSENPQTKSIESQNKGVDGQLVETNMDKMAMALAKKSSAADAWAAIFQKPSEKSWQDIKAAFKVNCLEPRNVPRLALLGKVGKELNRLGVPYGNITIYDGGSPTCTAVYDTEYTKSNLPDGMLLSDDLGGKESKIILPDGGEEGCLKALAEGTVDILVNFVVNKGHYIEHAGKFTLALKNHIGSIKFDHDLKDPAKFTDKIIAINQSKQILGSGEVPLQQLCVVDSLWAMKGGPNGQLDSVPCCLAMGTLAPIVDYLTVKKIREVPLEDNGGKPYGMGVTNTKTEVLNRFVSGFGYDPDSEQIKNLDFVNALTYS